MKKCYIQGCQIQILEIRIFSWKIRSWSGDFPEKIRRKIRRLFLESRRKTGECHVVFFEKAKIFTLTNVYNFGFYQTSNEKVCLTKRNKEKQGKIITYNLFYWSFRNCSFKNIKKQVQIGFKKPSKYRNRTEQPVCYAVLSTLATRLYFSCEWICFNNSLLFKRFFHLNFELGTH